jgi:hypothetical protein
MNSINQISVSDSLDSAKGLSRLGQIRQTFNGDGTDDAIGAYVIDRRAV